MLFGCAHILTNFISIMIYSACSGERLSGTALSCYIASVKGSSSLVVWAFRTKLRPPSGPQCCQLEKKLRP